MISTRSDILEILAMEGPLPLGDIAVRCWWTDLSGVQEVLEDLQREGLVECYESAGPFNPYREIATLYCLAYFPSPEVGDLFEALGRACAQRQTQILKEIYYAQND